MFFRVSLPLAARGILAGGLLAFARALGEFGATLMIAGNLPGRTQTLSVAVYSAVQAGDDSHREFPRGRDLGDVRRHPAARRPPRAATHASGFPLICRSAVDIRKTFVERRAPLHARRRLYRDHAAGGAVRPVRRGQEPDAAGNRRPAASRRRHDHAAWQSAVRQRARNRSEAAGAPGRVPLSRTTRCFRI